MNVFIIGITGAVGSRLARRLRRHDDVVGGLVRKRRQSSSLSDDGIETRIGDLARLDSAELAAMLEDADAIVFAAGSNGGASEITRAIDGDGLVKAVDAARLAGVDRFILVSVLPEAWRERDLGQDAEYYFAVKKQADVALSRSDLDWLVLRPSLLLDEPGTGTISLGPAELHGEISRDDVAETLVELLHEPRIGRQILELTSGPTPIPAAVDAVASRR